MPLHQAFSHNCASAVLTITRLEEDRSAGRFASVSGLPRQRSTGEIGLRPASPVPGIDSCRPGFHLLVLVLCCCLAACAELPRNVAKTLWGWEEHSAKTPPSPGQNLIVHPNFIQESDSCIRKKLPLLLIEKSELTPASISPGEEFNHRFIYVFCPRNKKSKPISGTLYRKIYFQDRLIFEDVSKRYQFKPGKWSVDAFITVPPEAKPGNYTLVVTFKAKNINLKKRTDLIIGAPEYPVQILQSSR